MKTISMQSKTVEGQTYNIMKLYAEYGETENTFRKECEAYGSEVVHFEQKGRIVDAVVHVA